MKKSLTLFAFGLLILAGFCDVVRADAVTLSASGSGSGSVGVIIYACSGDDAKCLEREYERDQSALKHERREKYIALQKVFLNIVRYGSPTPPKNAIYIENQSMHDNNLSIASSLASISVKLGLTAKDIIEEYSK